MSNREFYQETFSQVHSSVNLRWEDFAQAQKPRRKRHVRRLWLLAAAIGLLVLLSAGAVAANLLGIRDLLLPQEQSALPSEQPAQENKLSLSGYINTPESRALAEWNDFLASYDPDGSILKVVGNYTDPALEQYRCYLVYTQDMADKLEEIAAKYSLTLHTWEHVVESQEEWVSLLGDFLGNNTAYSGPIAEDGTFHYDGYLTTASGTQLNYQFRRSVKGTLNDAFFTVDDLSAYEEWYYKTEDGWDLTLDLGPGRGFLLTDLGDSFVFVTVLGGTDQGVTKQDMKNLADSFDFSLLTPAQPLDQSLREPQPQESAPEVLPLSAGLEQVLLKDGSFYDADYNRTLTLTQFLKESAPEGHQLTADTFTAIDLDRDGATEVVLRLVLESGAHHGWEVLRQGEDGTVYGYILTPGEMLDLKTDGSYCYSYNTSSGFGRMFFADTDASGRPQHSRGTAPNGSVDTVTDADGSVYTDWYLNYQTVTQAEYEAALAIQQSKEDISWRSLREMQISSAH